MLRRRTFLELSAASAATAMAGCGPKRSALLPTGPDGFTASLGGKIEHFIVLMMENRSYDQMLGALRGPEHDGVPDGASLPYEIAGRTEQLPIRFGAPPDRFSPDPGHDFHAVHEQIRGRGDNAKADMSGFARRYLADHPSIDRAHLESYATLYGDGHLPVLQTLAKEFGVCSHWFSAVPSSTAPNRMFAHAGTTGGATHKGAYYARLRGKMIFDKLGNREPRSFRVYFHDMPHLWLTGDAWTKSFSGHFHLMPTFARDVREDRLPTYSFLEPQHLLPPWSSQHPSGGVSYGEKLIAHVYDTLVSNPAVFAKSLLLIVYDEHGGFYDHVVPPGHPGWQDAYPGIEHRVISPDRARGEGHDYEKGYDFTTLGPRVPAVVVSPWIERGSVFGWKASNPAHRVTFDHTSILATVGEMTGVWVDSERARAAKSLEVVLNRKAPRSDYPSHMPFDPSVYRARVAPDVVAPEAPRTGVAEELHDAFREEHGKDASPEELVEHMRGLLES
jgi:phospholipase C